MVRFFILRKYVAIIIFLKKIAEIIAIFLRVIQSHCSIVVAQGYENWLRTGVQSLAWANL